MDDSRLARAIRALRHRRGWRQVEVAAAAGVSQSTVSRIESGRVGSMRLDDLRQVARALGAGVDLTLRWRGGELERLLDADHATLQATMTSRLGGLGWIVHAEATYSQYGERGSFDLLAFHPPTAIVLAVEVKTVIVDVQALLRALDAKVRLGPSVARGLGWVPAAVVPLLVIVDQRTARRRVAAVEPLLARFTVRGTAARRWLKAPQPFGGLLTFESLPAMRGVNARQAGRQRISRPTGGLSVPREPEGVASSQIAD